MPNQLYFGDNLRLLQNRQYFPNESVDLIYLDPPFNSSRDYNLLFKENDGLKTEAQIVAFKDTWTWTADTRDTYFQLLESLPPRLAKTLEALPQIVG